MQPIDTDIADVSMEDVGVVGGCITPPQKERVVLLQAIFGTAGEPCAPKRRRVGRATLAGRRRRASTDVTAGPVEEDEVADPWSDFPETPKNKTNFQSQVETDWRALPPPTLPCFPFVSNYTSEAGDVWTSLPGTPPFKANYPPEVGQDWLALPPIPCLPLGVGTVTYTEVDTSSLSGGSLIDADISFTPPVQQRGKSTRRRQLEQQNTPIATPGPKSAEEHYETPAKIMRGVSRKKVNVGVTDALVDAEAIKGVSGTGGAASTHMDDDECFPSD